MKTPDSSISSMERVLTDFLRSEFTMAPDVEVNRETPLISSGLIDSFSLVSLQRFIEKEFGKRVPPPRMRVDSFDTVKQIAEMISKL